jgi:molybdopterin-guanine dinucleotide biosynthesis protein A
MDARYGAVVLCGGRSTRMGLDKATLPFGAETLLERVVRLVGKVVHDFNTVVVASPNQELPPLPAGVKVIHESSGPLPALIAGLSQLPTIVEAAFVTACDTPLLKPAVIEWLLQRWATEQTGEVRTNQRFVAVAPVDGRHVHPLCAVYGTACRVGLAATVAYEGDRSLQYALTSKPMGTVLVPVEELGTADPELESLVNCNTWEEYERALRLAGVAD